VLVTWASRGDRGSGDKRDGVYHGIVAASETGFDGTVDGNGVVTSAGRNLSLDFLQDLLTLRGLWPEVLVCPFGRLKFGVKEGS